MGIVYFEDYLSDIEYDDQDVTDLAELEAENPEELEKTDVTAKCRRTIEYYQERKRLRNDLEYFS